MQNEDLRNKLKKVAKHETDYHLSGVSFATRQGVVILTEEAVDYVIESIENGIKLLKDKNYEVVNNPIQPM